MPATGRKWLLIATAFVELGTGLSLLCLPSFPLELLLGVSPAAPEAEFIARIAGAALLAIGVVCWQARSDRNSPTQRGVLAGVLIYDVAAAGLLAFAGSGLGMTGIALWPAVVLHSALAAWCAKCFLVKLRGQGGQT
jgi:hypothetical protein